MKFRRINDRTVNCIITQQDLEDSGVALDDIFERRRNAVEFIRGVLSRAAESDELRLDGELTSMKITVLPDKSVSLTLSADPESTPEAEILSAQRQEIYIYHFEQIADLLACCRHLVYGTKLASSLYREKEGGGYWLLVRRGGSTGADYERLVLSINEFGELVPSSETREAYIREHEECLLKDSAIEQLAVLARM